MDQAHTTLIGNLADSVRRFYQQRTSFKIYRGATNSTRMISFDKDKMIDVSSLNRILHINKITQTALVEPNVPMDQLVRSTLRHGLVPPVVMEFPGITVGGGAQGGAGESSSYKWGTFNRTINWYEMILGNGSVVRASRTERADLFWGTAGSFGSLGVITAAEVQLVPAKRYVVLEYLPIDSFDAAIAAIKTETARRPDFIDGIMFSKTSGVIMVGNLCDDSPAPRRSFAKAYQPWFYLHAQKQAASGQRITEKIPLRDYLFRYDRGAFWMGAYAFQRFKTPFNRLTRWIMNPLMHTRKMYQALQASGISQECIVQDLAIPARHAVAFLQYVDRALNIYPLWLCPLLPDRDSPFLSSHLRTDAIINVGVWGAFDGTYEAWVQANKDLEAEVHHLHGKKWLYAYAFYDESTFWQIYDPTDAYQKLRGKYHAETLPTIYEKIGSSRRYKVSGRKGVLFAALGLNALRRRPSGT